jgi:hypothetical protein
MERDRQVQQMIDAAIARGKNPYQNRVIKNVLGLSAETVSYSKAKREWDYHGEVIDHGPLKEQIPKPAKCQFCGHPIRYGYGLHNSVNQKFVEVGSECLGNFIEITPAIASTLDADKRAAAKQRKNRQLKRRKDIYIAAQGEAGKVKEAVCAAAATGNEGYREDREYILKIGNNAATLYSGITSGEFDRLAKKYGVTVDLDKITAFIAEAEPLKPLDRISAF